MGKKIELLIDENDTSKLEAFGNATTNYLPNSIFLGHIQTDTIEDKFKIKTFKTKPYNIAPCPKCLEAITNPASSDYLNDSYKCTHYTNTMSDIVDYCSYSVHFSKGMTLLVTDASTVNELFYLSQLELTALFSIEKPSIKVTIKDDRLKEVVGGQNFIYIRAPFSVKSALNALNAKESEIDYLFFHENDNKKCVIVKENISFINDNDLTQKLKNLNNNPTINRALNLELEAKFKGAITANMSRMSGINFIVSNEVGVKKVVQFQEFNLSQFLNDMQQDKLKSKMFTNFEKKYPHVIKNLEFTIGANIFETLSIILELDSKSFEALCDKSYEFRGNGGVKIDMYFTDDGFDFVSLFGSIMSFKLAIIPIPTFWPIVSLKHLEI